MVLYGTVWYCMILYGTVWYCGTAKCTQTSMKNFLEGRKGWQCQKPHKLDNYMDGSVQAIQRTTQVTLSLYLFLSIERVSKLCCEITGNS